MVSTGVTKLANNDTQFTVLFVVAYGSKGCAISTNLGPIDNIKVDISLLSDFSVVVSEMVVLPYSVIYYIYIPGTLGPCFNYYVQSIDVQSMVFANDRIHYGLQVLFVGL